MSGEPKGDNRKPYVFVSHSHHDAWVAQQIASKILHSRAGCFIDKRKIGGGDLIDEEIIKGADESTELLILLTPWALGRPYVMMELGLFCNTGKRIVGVVHGLNETERTLLELGLVWGAGMSSPSPSTNRSNLDQTVVSRLPIVLTQSRLLSLNKIDVYFAELKIRVNEWKRSNDAKGNS